MSNETIFGIIISILLSINGLTLGVFVTNVRELKRVIQELSLSIKGSQKDIEFLNRTLNAHEKMLEKHSDEINELKTR